MDKNKYHNHARRITYVSAKGVHMDAHPLQRCLTAKQKIEFLVSFDTALEAVRRNRVHFNNGLAQILTLMNCSN